MMLRPPDIRSPQPLVEHIATTPKVSTSIIHGKADQPWSGRQRLLHPLERLVATPCKSPLLDQTVVRYFKMKERSGNRHCAAFGPNSVGNVAELRYIGVNLYSD